MFYLTKETKACEYYISQSLGGVRAARLAGRVRVAAFRRQNKFLFELAAWCVVCNVLPGDCLNTNTYSP